MMVTVEDLMACIEDGHDYGNEPTCKRCGHYGPEDKEHILRLKIQELEKDKQRLDWLQKHSFAFIRHNRTGKGTIRLSDSYIDKDNQGYDLRRAIDKARES